MAIGNWGDDKFEPLDIPLDPLQYIGRVTRNPETGRVASMEVFYGDDVIRLESGDEFITFTTVVLMGGD